MIVEVSMKSDVQKFEVHNWWATSPDFVLHALSRQLEAAKAIWPAELGAVCLCAPSPTPPTTEPASGLMPIPQEDVA